MSESSETKVPPSEEFAAKSHISAEQYEEMYRRSIEDPEGFWGEIADNFV